MTERKFTRGLSKPGMAAQVREAVSEAVRESACLVSRGPFELGMLSEVHYCFGVIHTNE